MRLAGIILTVIGGATLVAGSVIAAVDIANDKNCHSGSCDSGPNVATFVGFPMLGGGALFAGVGIPLWVVGSRPATVSLGPGRANLRFEF